MIEMDWEVVGGDPAIRAVSWARAVDPEHQNARTAGDLVVRYSVAVYANPDETATAPIDTTGNDWRTTPTATVPGNAVTTAARVDGDEWVLPTPLAIPSGVAFCIEVTAHYEFHDGTNPIDQNPAVSRTSFMKSVAPNTPLPAPAVTLEWVTDTGISKGTASGNGHFRFARTAAAMNYQPGRDPVPAAAVFDFPAQGNQPAANGLPNQVRSVDVDISYPATTAARPAIPADTHIVFDFPAIAGLPAVTGAASPVRAFTETATDHAGGNAYIDQTVGWTGFGADFQYTNVHVRLDLRNQPPPITANPIQGPWATAPPLGGPANSLAQWFDARMGLASREINNIAVLQTDPNIGNGSNWWGRWDAPDFIQLRDGMRVTWDGTDWVPWTPLPAPTPPQTNLAALRADPRFGDGTGWLGTVVCSRLRHIGRRHPSHLGRWPLATVDRDPVRAATRPGHAHHRVQADSSPLRRSDRGRHGVHGGPGASQLG